MGAVFALPGLDARVGAALLVAAGIAALVSETAVGGLTQRAFVAVLLLWTLVVAARLE